MLFLFDSMKDSNNSCMQNIVPTEKYNTMDKTQITFEKQSIGQSKNYAPHLWHNFDQRR